MKFSQDPYTGGAGTGADYPGDESDIQSALEERIRELEEKLQAQQEELEVQNEELRVQVNELNSKNIELEKEIAVRKRSEARLRVSEENLARAQRVARLGNWFWNLKNNRIYCSDEFYRIFGIPRRDYITLERFIEALCLEDTEHVRQALQTAIDTHTMYDIDYCALLPNGTESIIHAHGEVVYGSDGSPDNMFGTVQDITERKHAEEALQKQAELIDLSPDAIIVRKLDGTITFWSHGAEVLYGWTKAEAIGRKTHDLIKTQFPMPLEDINSQLIETGRWFGELTHITKDGREVIVQSSWLARRDKLGHIDELLESNVDITRLKRLETELRESRNRAELYLDIMGHDINNLNQVTIGSLELIMDDRNLTGEQREMVADALNSARGSASIIDNVHKIQAINEGLAPMHREDINHMILDCIEHVPKLDDRQVTINYAPRKGLVIVGTALMKEVFCNLINNAVKHSERDVTMDIWVDEVERYGKKFYDVSIADNGPGIPDEIKPKLFNRFQRGGTKAHGKGLGLFIVKSLVEQAGGDVTVGDRVPGDFSKGAKFTVTLPAYGGVK